VDGVTASAIGDDIEAFAAEVDALLASHPVGPLQYFKGRGGPLRELYRELGSRGWLSVSWPVEHGGGGRPLRWEYTLWNRLAYHRTSRPELGATIMARVLMRHGTPSLQAELLPSIRSGSVCFALGYSEPEAGSDLASVRTRATPDGAGYRVDGEKVWTSEAHHAEYLWCLCRTGEQAERGRALTLLVIDLNAPGVTVRPIPTIDGHHVNQVTLEGVTVPAGRRVGEESGAWRIVTEGLAAERHLQFLPGRVRRDLEDLVSLCRRSEVMAQPGVRERLAELCARVIAAEACALAGVAEADAGGVSATTAAATKLLGSQLAQDIARAAYELCGTAALDATQTVELLWRESFMETIAGGSTEMLLGVIAREALQLMARA
jgi:alkylation response protein AidB-like acyl-CoA dehydrogenase